MTKGNPLAVQELGVQFVDQQTLLAECDIISLHLPLNPSTLRIVNEDVLLAMKPGALLINVSRGGLVDTDALIRCLESGHLGGAGLDVYENVSGLNVCLSLKSNDTGCVGRKMNHWVKFSASSTHRFVHGPCLLQSFM